MGYRQLTQGERYVMANMFRQRYSLRAIAKALDRSPSTISRERKRNASSYDGGYRVERAQEHAMARRWRSRKKSQYSQQEWDAVADQLRGKWSPEQIAGRRKVKGGRQISKETIYRYVRRERKAGGKLWTQLRIVSKFGRKRRGSPCTRGKLLGKRHISERPKAVERRRQLGHWEGDTVMGSDMRHCVLTLVERVSGYLVMHKLHARTKEQASTALARMAIALGAKLKTITLDNGTEFHDYEIVERRFGVKFYFATPYHSWERGTNENTNGLVRQYLPKGMCMSQITQADCNQIAKELNDRPRARLGFKTPSETLARF